MVTRQQASWLPIGTICRYLVRRHAFLLHPNASRWTGHSSRNRLLSTPAEQEAQAQRRHEGILMHPDSISSLIRPGNQVVKVNTRTGASKLRTTELEYGYFWMMKDLRRCDNKPVLTNESLIPPDMAKSFPSLSVQRLAASSSDKIAIPEHFVRHNRARDEHAQCTLVGVSFRDFGYQMLPSWIDPFTKVFGDSQHNVPGGPAATVAAATTASRHQVYRLNIAEGWFNKYVLRGIIQGTMKNNTPSELHHSTLLHFGQVDAFRDALRMHNVLTGYVFLLDGLGRVRWTASGAATDNEVQLLVACANELTAARPRSAINKQRFP